MTRKSAPLAVLTTLPAWMLPLALGALVVVGFFLWQVNIKRPLPSPSFHVAADEYLKPGALAPDFGGVGFKGERVELSALRGKVVLVNFFASWCTECRAEFPDIQAAYSRYRSAGFEVIGVDAIDPGDGRAFYNEMGVTFPAILDPLVAGRPGKLSQAYDLASGALPVSVFIDRNGKVGQVYPGRIGPADITQQLTKFGVIRGA